MEEKVRREEVYANQYIAGLVKRYHTWPMIKEQTVAAHSWRVATLFIEIFGIPRAEVIVYILYHDLGEQWAGDMPFGTKQAIPGLKEATVSAEKIGLSKLKIELPQLEPSESVKVKICDLLEMWETGVYEKTLGNKYADPIIDDTWAQAVNLSQQTGLNELVSKWFWRNIHGSKQDPNRG